MTTRMLRITALCLALVLLLAGLVLILVAGSNEMLKQRGDSLKSRAGRFWEDWTW